MPQRIAICVKLDAKTAQQLRAAAQFLRGYPHLESLQSIMNKSVESYLDRLRGEHRAALKEHGGLFPESKPLPAKKIR